MVLELSGTKENFDAGVRFMKEKAPRGTPFEKRDPEYGQVRSLRGLHRLLPHEAPSMDPATSKIIFDPERCNGCEFCVTACPARAMSIDLF